MSFLAKLRRTPNSGDDYERKLRNEHERFRDQSNVHDLPPIFHYWAHTYVRPMAAEYGFTSAEDLYAKYLGLWAKAHPAETPVFLSLGAGNCDAEVRVAQMLRRAGLARFTIECLDLNPLMLRRGRELAKDSGVEENFEFTEGDFNSWKAAKRYSAVIANQALHHVLEFEHLLDEIKRSLRPDGYFVTSDMIGRNGHLRWPEALREVRRFWRELPTGYRWNRALERYEEEYINHDCSTDEFEGIRAQDILPLLLERFDFHLFVAFGNVINVFVDRSFGFNFDAAAEWDRGFIDRVHAFDEQAIVNGTLTPTQMSAVMTPEPCAEHHYSRGLTPAQCIRKAKHGRVSTGFGGVPLEMGTTSLRPAEEGGIGYEQQLNASGGRPPYVWSAAGLPPEVELHATGLLAGRVRESGVFTPAVTVADHSSPRQVVRQSFTIIVKEDQILPRLRITSRARLRSGRVGANHVQALSARGGKPPYRWSVAKGALPPGLRISMSSGIISGRPAQPGNSRFTVRSVDSGSEQTASDFELSIDLEAKPGRFVLPQVACGAGWKTHLRLFNASASEVGVTVRFRADDGAPLRLPLLVDPGGQERERDANEVISMVAPCSALHIETGEQYGVERAGWAEVACTGPLAGYAAYDSPSARAVTAELVSVLEPSFLLPFDNTEGCRVGVALVNPGKPEGESDAASIVATIWDDEWRELGAKDLRLPANGHASFMLEDKLPLTAGRRGLIEFRADAGGRVSGLGLRFEADGRFVVIPRLLGPAPSS